MQLALESVGITTRSLRKVLKRSESEDRSLSAKDRLPLSAETERALQGAAESQRDEHAKVGWRQLLIEILLDEDSRAKVALKQMPAVNKWAPVGALSELVPARGLSTSP